MSIITGKEYLWRINRLKADIWMDGERIVGELSSHRAFSGVMRTQAELYDIQHASPELSFRQDTTGKRVSNSYKIPLTIEDLIARRKLTEAWARHTGGLMGRSPDYMNTVLTAFRMSTIHLQKSETVHPDRLVAFYEEACEKDYSFTHTFMNPQRNRSQLAMLDDDCMNAHVVKTNQEGIVVKGAKLLATQGGMTDELLVYSAPGVADKRHAYLFSVPTNTKGISYHCRESFKWDDIQYNAPLSSRFDENDALVVFDEVLVPWERVFIYEDILATHQLYVKGYFTPLTLHTIVSRQVVKTELLLGIAQSVVDAIGIGEYEHVQLKVAQIAKGLESMRALLHYAEQSGEKMDGYYIPNRIPLLVAVNTFQETYPRFTEIIEQLGASGMITLFSEKDFESEVGEKLSYYLETDVADGKEKVRLFRLAWDICMSPFGTRQTLYERFFFGDAVRLAKMIYDIYPKDDGLALVSQLLKDTK